MYYFLQRLVIMSGVCPAERIIPIYAFSDRRPENDLRGEAWHLLNRRGF